MNHLKSFKLFEKIYIGKIGVKDYSFLYNKESKGAFIEIIFDNDSKYQMEVKGDDKPTEKKGDKYLKFRIFYPNNLPVYFEKFIDNWTYMFNKNKLGYKMKLEKIEKPKYGLKPYGIISVNPEISLLEMEKLIESTKKINKYIKDRGGFDQWTF